MMNRRALLMGLIAAPLVARIPGILMPVRPFYETLHGDGFHSDGPAFRAMWKREPVWHRGVLRQFFEPNEHYNGGILRVPDGHFLMDPQPTQTVYHNGSFRITSHFGVPA